MKAREAARDAALAKQVVEAIAREMTKAHVHYQAMIHEISTGAMPTSLKVTSSASGFKVMDLFDWTNLSNRDGKCGQKRLDMPMMQCKGSQKTLQSHTSIIGLIVKDGQNRVMEEQNDTSNTDGI